MKLVLALIVALQVSVCLCDVPEPDKELVEKYEGLKAIFLKRLATAYENAHAAFEKLSEGTITGTKAKEIIEEAKKNERLQAWTKLFSGVAGDLQPAIEKGRLSALGVYGEYLRPYIGMYLDALINNHVKPVLDLWLPVESH